MRPTSNTVFLIVHQGFAARFLLRTDILRTLKRASARIVILTPNADEPYIAAEFGEANMFVEPLRADAEVVTRSRLWSLLYHLRHFTLGSSDKSAAFRQKYAGSRKSLRVARPFAAWCIHVAVQLLWRSRTLRRLLVAVESRLYAPDLHGDLFERYSPSLVVTTSPGYFLPDAVVLREARRRRVPTVAIVLGWDNPTSKGYRGATPDRIIVWSDRMVQQVVEHQDFPRERVLVGGVPHFDHYRRENALLTRAELCTRLGLESGRRLILFATSSPGLYRHNALVAETLARAIVDGALGEPAQLVVRLHPINFRPDHREPLDAYERLRSRYEHVVLDVPEILSERLRCDMPASDGIRLGSLMKHCDVLVNIFSTTTLEAFLLDRPVVFVSSGAHLADETLDVETQEDEDEPAPWHEYLHLQSVVEQGAARIASSMPELVALVRDYLRHPELDREKRLGIARAECGPTDGRAGERIGRYLLELMGLDAGDALGSEEPVGRLAAAAEGGTPAGGGRARAERQAR